MQTSIQGFQLSPQQQRIWALQKKVFSPVYRAQCTILIEGYLDNKILELAIEKVVERNEILRTSFQIWQGMTMPFQVISDRQIPPIHYSNLENLDSAQQIDAINTLLTAESQIAFNLENGSVLNLALAKISPEKHLLFISLPALCADRETLKNLVGEIGQVYAACLQGEDFIDEPLQYADIAQWQNDLFQGEEAIGREYWGKKDISEFLSTKLLAEKPLSENQEFSPKFVSVIIPSQIAEGIEAIAKIQETTTAMFLQASWQVLLFRLTGQSDIVVGAGFDGRNYEELALSLGLLAKYLPIHVCLNESISFGDILQQVSEQTTEAGNWQEYFTWEQIAAETAFFPFCFEFEQPSQKYVAGDVSFSIHQEYSCIDRFKVKFLCRQDDDLIAEFHYDSNCFDSADIERLASQFQTLLESAIANPETAIGELGILSAIARQQLLLEFNNTKTEYPPYQCIHRWFEAQAAQTPDSIAVVFEQQKLTYRELNAKANQLAHYLQQLGVKPETIVGLCVERSLDLIVGILGILKAGGAYLPLDPVLPSERLSFMLKDAQVSLVVSQKVLTNDFQHIADVVYLDTDWDAIAQQSQENLLTQTNGNNLVYVMYTSGSTGKPKGVAVKHSSLVNYVNGINARLEIPSNASFAMVSTFAADLGNTALFPSLCTGGCLHIISQECATDPVTLADYFCRYPIDCIKITPSHLAALLLSSEAEQILPRQRLILGGETTRWKLIEQIQQFAPKCQIFNHYGPTETTVGVTAFKIEGGQINTRSQTVPLGRPLANIQIYILDSFQQLVPIGVAGELHIGGDSLARGYLNQGNLTNEKFVHNFFGDTKFREAEPLTFRSQAEPGNESEDLSGRLYKTGDLARYLPDGNIEFLGRIDEQVKIRGFRIELGEIEAVIRQHPGVREVIVLAREDQPGNKRLVAYIVPCKEQEIAGVEENFYSGLIAELQNFLQQQLPEYMMPVLVPLKSLPLTPNGKINRQALPAPDTAKPKSEKTFACSYTPIEAKLAEIWAQVLGIKQVGIRDNFFELGGDSILSIQVIAKANQIGLRLTPKKMYEYQTIAELATVVDATPTIKAEQGEVTGIVPLTPIQHWFFKRDLADSHHFNQSILLEVRQSINPILLQQAVQYLLTHHDALRLQFVRDESSWQQIISPVSEVPFSQIDLSEFPEIEQKTILETKAAELQASLNLSAAPLVRVAWFNLGAEKNSRLLIVAHHLVIDGVSWRVLLEDLQTAYQQLSQGQTIALPAKTTSFKQWAYYLQEYADSAALQQEKDYWLSIFTGKITPLATDYQGGENAIANAETLSVALTPQQTQALLHEVPQAYNTQINDVLLTALVQAFARWTGNHTLLLDLESHGREGDFQHIDLSRTVGWFTSIFPVLLDLEKISQPGEALKAIKEQLRSVPNRGIGYGVWRYLKADSVDSIQSLPQAEVRFNYLGQFDQVLSESSLFGLAKESSGSSHSLRQNRHYLLDISGFVVGGELTMSWTYSRQIYQKTTVENLAQGFVEALRALIFHCQSNEAGGYTPSDFPKAQLNQKNLDSFLAKLNRANK